ncbi:tyrosine-type recombinase/integrase [Streptococcus parasanguinis]
MSVDADGPFLTDRVCSNTTPCKLGVPSKKFSITKGFEDFKGGKIRQKVESKSMAKNEHLRSVFDWIQIQFDKTEFSPKEIIEDILFLDFDLFIENKGSLKYYNYDSQLHYGNIRIYYGSKHFLTLFNDDEYNIKLLFTVLFFTGLRLGEALALTWKDIEFSTNTIHVSKSVYVKKGEEHISGTKTKAGTRRIIMNNKLVETLEEWKQTQHEKLKEFTSSLDDLQIFQNSPITITKDSIEKQYKKILQRDNTLKKIRIHDFRHSHASLLINQGEDYLVVKERLGHASITTTIDTYSHLYPSKQQKLADKLDDLL